MLQFGSPVLQRKGRLSRVIPVLVAVSCRSTARMGQRGRYLSCGSPQCGYALRILAVFQLEALFRRRFMCEQPLHQIIVDKNRVPPHLILKRGVQLRTPVAGAWSRARVDISKLSSPSTRNSHRAAPESVLVVGLVACNLTTRSASGRPDTRKSPRNKMSLWCTCIFDAKYRVEHVSELLGDNNDDEGFRRDENSKSSDRTAAKYADLLKMHAYRDAAHRTAGAYVLYPGEPGEGQKFEGFHEVLPGLGAFAIRPDSEGKAQGMAALEEFLTNVIEHIANRTTARERVTYHISESYLVKDPVVTYGKVHLRESDLYGKEYRAPCPQLRIWS